MPVYYAFLAQLIELN